MSKKKYTSVKVTATIHTDKKSRGSFAPFIIKFLILLCGCLGSFFTFLTCIDIGVSKLSVIITAALSCAYFSFIFSMKEKYFRIVSPVSAAVFLCWVYAVRYDICAGIANVSNIYMSNVKYDFRETPFIIIHEPELAQKHIGVFVCFAVILICGFAVHAAIRGNSASGVCIATCLPVFSVLLYGFEPSNTAFFSAIVCWAAMFALEANAAESISDARCRKYSAYCGLYAAVISALCIIGVMVSSKLLGYERPEKLNIIYEEAVEYIHGGGVQQVIEEIVTIASRNVVPTGAINHGKLGEFDEISFDGRTVLEVTMPKSEETVYLRGFVGSVYTGKSWEQLPSSKLKELEEITASFSVEGLSPLIMDGYNLKYTRAQMPKYSFSVKNTGANTNYLYMPYNLVPESVSRYRIVNGSSFGGSQTSYIGQYYDPRNYYGYQDLFRKRWSVPTALSEDEALYRHFVYENYLDIPESFSPAMIFNESYYRYISAETESTGKSTLDEMTVFSRKLYFIKKWLRDNCEYSLSAGKLPSGEDFVNNFLERKTGSCSHFASAAVIMCRYAGIPARYAEGYIIKPADFPSETAVGQAAQVDVSDARGHAWAEVYLDGYGWYPVEFTSGYGNVRTAIPTETTTVETESETESKISESEPEDAVTTTFEATSPVPQETAVGGQSQSVQESSQNAESAVTSAPSGTHSENPQESSSDENPANRKPVIGFSVFGIEGGKKVDVQYDLTWLVILAAVIILIPTVIVVRRNIIIAKRRRTADRSAQAGALDDYRRFGKLLRLMKLPEQSELSYSDYAKELSERSALLSDGTAEYIIGFALKASFGGGSITRSEANEMRLAVNSLAKRYGAAQSRFGKFRLKFIYCLL